jgi:hypothetical protein
VNSLHPVAYSGSRTHNLAASSKDCCDVCLSVRPFFTSSESNGCGPKASCATLGHRTLHYTALSPVRNRLALPFDGAVFTRELPGEYVPKRWLATPKIKNVGCCQRRWFRNISRRSSDHRNETTNAAAAEAAAATGTLPDGSVACSVASSSARRRSDDLLPSPGPLKATDDGATQHGEWWTSSDIRDLDGDTWRGFVGRDRTCRRGCIVADECARARARIHTHTLVDGRGRTVTHADGCL